MMEVDDLDSVRLGIVGIGNIGTFHTTYLLDAQIKGATLTAVCDIDQAKLHAWKAKHGDHIKCYRDYKEMLQSGQVDAVLIATPHYDHPVIAMDAFAQGLHVLVEKPAGVFCKDVLEMNEAAQKSGKIFSIMFCLRTDPYFIKIRDLIHSGELGELKRINWIATDWYRPQSYHDSSSWRSTWEGEGGGVLINQCPHNIDLWQWMFGMPATISAFADFGKYYDIQVEDDVTVYMRYKNGVTGVFIASTGEAPGTNRLEIMGTMGKLVLENKKLTFSRNRISEREFNANYKGGRMPRPECWECEIPVDGSPMSHKTITQNFIDAILDGKTELIAPGENGINELTLSNAMHMSAWTGETVSLPMDHDRYFSLLQQKISGSGR